MFKWSNLRWVYLGLEAGSGYLNNQGIQLKNFNGFTKLEFGALIYVKKICFGWRGSFLFSGDKNAGNVNDVKLNGKIENSYHTLYMGYMANSPKYIMIEPAIFYTLNKGRVFYDSVKYGNYSKNYPETIYQLQTIGIGFNTYWSINRLFPKIAYRFLPMYIYTQISFQIPNSIRRRNFEHIQHFSLGISLFPFYYNKPRGCF